ncbi:ABC transporter substrate-binding protein [Nonomuraea sp. NPDC050153]|uniref:ABC transporter substrate-binding protein n=1 Tax=Nonomuraea sp. NPDC050153 TaxID=3364359 RepID=UPI0037B25A35
MRDLRRLTAAAVALGSVAALALSGCGSARQQPTTDSSPGLTLSATTPRPKGDIPTFTWALYAEPPTLDYIYAFDYPQNMVLSNVCESLTRWTPQLTTEPGLAQKVTNPNPKTWVYDLRPGVKFHDGGTMTADDAVYSLRRHLDSKLGSYWAGEFANVDSIDKTGPLQVTVRLKRPDSGFPQAMATSAGTVVNARAVRAEGQGFGTADGGLDCTGPFKLGAWTKGQSVELDRFDGYWGTRARSGKVTFSFVSDDSARTNAFLTGEADGGYGISPTSFAQLRSAGTLYFGAGLTTNDLIVTDLKGTLADVRVRKALFLAIDRQGYLKAALGGGADLAQAPAPRDSWAGAAKATVDAAYAGLPAGGRDLAQAKKLVQEAGATGRPVTVATSPISPAFAILANAVQDAGRQIGLNVQIKTVAPDAYTALFTDPKARAGIDLVQTFWYLSVTDPLSLYSNFRSDDFSNYGGYRDPAYDKLVDEATAEYDPAERAELTAKLQQKAAGELLWLPIADVHTSLFLGRKITGAPTSICYLYYPWAADVGAAG